MIFTKVAEELLIQKEEFYRKLGFFGLNFYNPWFLIYFAQKIDQLVF